MSRLTREQEQAEYEARFEPARRAQEAKLSRRRGGGGGEHKKFLWLCAGLGACVGGLAGYFFFLVEHPGSVCMGRTDQPCGKSILQWMEYRTDEFLVWAAIGAGIAALIAQLWKHARAEVSAHHEKEDQA